MMTSATVTTNLAMEMVSMVATTVILLRLKTGTTTTAMIDWVFSTSLETRSGRALVFR
ncbi:hypothetical protein M6B38_388770 [Iris pallida]|uniref:Uncharacterized protein n=1 Tax=Iris pallida TaxID=29817 RepID=A0AAX6G1W0_IRIPA|nr:hypothetical protein M6B38_388770 [Iris pallida]